MKNYVCARCGTVLQQDSQPRITPCPAGMNHQFYDVGTVGSTAYQCVKCGVIVQSDGQPKYAPCKSGTNHQWSRL